MLSQWRACVLHRGGRRLSSDAFKKPLEIRLAVWRQRKNRIEVLQGAVLARGHIVLREDRHARDERGNEKGGAAANDRFGRADKLGEEQGAGPVSWAENSRAA